MSDPKCAKAMLQAAERDLLYSSLSFLKEYDS